MKLKAPQGAGDPSVAGVIIEPCDGVYEVEPDTAALLIESFGFVAITPVAAPRPKTAAVARRNKPAGENDRRE